MKYDYTNRHGHNFLFVPCNAFDTDCFEVIEGANVQDLLKQGYTLTGKVIKDHEGNEYDCLKKTIMDPRENENYCIAR